MSRQLSIALGLAFLSATAWAKTSGAARLWMGAGFDSNARRDFTSNDGLGVSAQPDGVASLLGSLESHYRSERAAATGSYDIGVRKFFRLSLEDVLVQSARVDGSVALTRDFDLGASGRVKHRIGGDRDYADLFAAAFIDYLPDDRASLRLEGGAHRFVYWQRLDASFGAADWRLEGRCRLSARHSLVTFGEAEFRSYLGYDNARPDSAGTIPMRRTDTVLVAGLGYSFKGPFTFGLTYSYGEQVSSSFGETTVRHRLFALAGFRLPFKLLLLAQAVLQFARYPDGLFLTSELLVSDDDERHNSASFKLIRPLSHRVDIELRYAVYQNRLGGSSDSAGYDYLRHVALAGLSLRL